MTPLPTGLTDRLLACAFARPGGYTFTDRWVRECARRGLLLRRAKAWIPTFRGWRYVRALRPLLGANTMTKRMVEANVRRARLALDKTQRQMADLFGVNLLTFGRWEREGRLPPWAQEKLAQMLVEAFPALRAS